MCKAFREKKYLPSLCCFLEFWWRVKMNLATRPKMTTSSFCNYKDKQLELCYSVFPTKFKILQSSYQCCPQFTFIIEILSVFIEDILLMELHSFYGPKMDHKGPQTKVTETPYQKNYIPNYVHMVIQHTGSKVPNYFEGTWIELCIWQKLFMIKTQANVSTSPNSL